MAPDELWEADDPEAADMEADVEMEVTDLDGTSHDASGWRWRFPAAGGLLACIVLLVALMSNRAAIPDANLPTSRSFPRAGFTPLPASTPGSWSGFTAMYVDSNLSDLTVTVNGVTLRGASPLEIQPAVGVNAVVVTASWFAAAHTCTFTMSPGRVVTAPQGCVPLLQRNYGNSMAASAVTALYLAVPFDLSALSPANQAAAQPAILVALDGQPMPPETATVPVGDYYVTALTTQGVPTGRQATAPLLASYGSDPLLDKITAPAYFGPTNVPLTTQPAGFPTGDDLLLDVPFESRWTFTDGSGTVISSVRDTTAEDNARVQLHWTGDGFTAANVATLISRLAFSPCQNMAQAAVLALIPPNVLSEFGNPMFTEYDASLSAQGCLTALTSNAPPTLSALPPTVPVFIDRFGILLAANDAAHALLPVIPMAPADEIAAVEGA